jgi:hypothetical protein
MGGAFERDRVSLFGDPCEVLSTLLGLEQVLIDDFDEYLAPASVEAAKEFNLCLIKGI